jgi:predicted transcriptional regulator
MMNQLITKNKRSYSSNRRNIIELHYDVLTALQEHDSLNISNMMRYASVSNSQYFYRKIEPLIRGGYIYKFEEYKYQITDKGKEYLGSIKDVLEVVNIKQ